MDEFELKEIDENNENNEDKSISQNDIMRASTSN